MTHDHDHSELLVRDLTPIFNQSRKARLLLLPKHGGLLEVVSAMRLRHVPSARKFAKRKRGEKA